MQITDTRVFMCVPCKVCQRQVFIHWRSWAKNVRNRSKRQPLRSYRPFQQRAPVNAEKVNSPILCVYTHQFAASFVTKKRHCEGSIIVGQREKAECSVTAKGPMYVVECAHLECELYINSVCTCTTTSVCRLFDPTLRSTSSWLVTCFALWWGPLYSRKGSSHNTELWSPNSRHRFIAHNFLQRISMTMRCGLSRD
jgi:hypothetical protein